MSVLFRPATREHVSLIIGLAGASGSGKTYTAMRLASGLAGDRPFAVIDTEAGRALHYADQFRFDHGDLMPPFRPGTYQAAIQTAEQAGYPVIVVDSFSHVHAGEGGTLDWHEEELTARVERAMKRKGEQREEWQIREANKMAAWIEPKQAHKRMVQRLLQVRAHLILCLRAEEKTDMVKDPKTGKLEIVPKQTLSGFTGWVPICDKTLPYELTASLLLLPDAPGVPVPIKLQAQHRPFFPLGEPITEAAGVALATWARGGATARVTPNGAGAGAVEGRPEAPVSGRAPTASAPSVLARIATACSALNYPAAQWEALVRAKLGGPLDEAPEEELERTLLPFLRALHQRKRPALDELAAILNAAAAQTA